MFCKNCGASMGDFDTICSNCGASSASYGGYSQPNYGEGSQEPIKTTGLLVWSIIEILCVNTITGIIALILWVTKLKPAADRGDVVEANKAKKPIKIVLWIGMIVIPFILLIIMLIAIPNFSGINGRMEVRADKATAAQIGKMTRVWYTDAIVEPSLNFNVEEVENGFVRLDQIDGIEAYSSTSYSPTSYEVDRKKQDGAYYVTIINEDEPSQAKIVVAIGPESLYRVSRDDDNFYKVFEKNLDGIDSSDATYDGNGSGIAWIEP